MIITGSGSAIPKQVVENDDLSQIVETSDEWISSRTGIKKRHIATGEESLSQFAAEAALQAMAMAQIAPTEIDLIILATSSADDMFGSAAKIQKLIGASRAVAFDLTAACSGFVFGLVVASQFIQAQNYQNVLVIGADLLSRWVNWSDRNTCVLFGDGAGAVVCQANHEKEHFLGFQLCSDGTSHGSLNLAYQGESQPLVKNLTIGNGPYGKITMNGREIYRFAVDKVPEVIEKALHRADLTAQEIDWLILHQANQRIMEAVAERLNIPKSKLISNVSEYGNTSSASIPIALDQFVRQGKIKPGDIIVTSGFGAGLSWGAAVFRWAI